MPSSSRGGRAEKVVSSGRLSEHAASEPCRIGQAPPRSPRETTLVARRRKSARSRLRDRDSREVTEQATGRGRLERRTRRGRTRSNLIRPEDERRTSGKGTRLPRGSCTSSRLLVGPSTTSYAIVCIHWSRDRENLYRRVLLQDSREEGRRLGKNRMTKKLERGRGRRSEKHRKMLVVRQNYRPRSRHILRSRR